MQYFFHLHECGVVTQDTCGANLSDLNAARDFAVREARIVMCSEIKAGHLCLDCHVEIVDDAGRALTIVPFREAVAVKGSFAGQAIPSH